MLYLSKKTLQKYIEFYIFSNFCPEFHEFERISLCPFWDSWQITKHYPISDCGFRIAECNLLKINIFRMWIADFGFRIAECNLLKINIFRMWIADFGFRIAECNLLKINIFRMWIADFGFRIAECNLLKINIFRMWIADCGLRNVIY
jgi:hypothetical protein